MIRGSLEWRSPTRGLKANWRLPDVEKLAADVWESLPSTVRGLLANPKFQGAPLVSLKDSVGWRVKVQDLVNNKILILPILRMLPDRTPSLFSWRT